jgi:hypothetical protein
MTDTDKSLVEPISLGLIILTTLLIYAHFKIDDKTINCTNKTIHLANRIILGIGITALMIVLGGITCRYKCHPCNTSLYTNNIIMIFFLILNISIIVLGVIMKEALNDPACTNITVPEIDILIAFSSVLMLGPLIYLGIYLRKIL